MGVSDAMLRDERRMPVAIAAPASGSGGENLDAALMLVDGGPTGCADPAFDANILPIGEWAAAAWEAWLARLSLEKLAKAGAHKMDKAKN